MQGRSAMLRPRPRLTRIVLIGTFSAILKLVVLFVVKLHNADFETDAWSNNSFTSMLCLERLAVKVNFQCSFEHFPLGDCINFVCNTHLT